MDAVIKKISINETVRRLSSIKISPDDDFKEEENSFRFTSEQIENAWKEVLENEEPKRAGRK